MTGGPAGPAGFMHAALLYRSDAEYAQAVMDLVGADDADGTCVAMVGKRVLLFDLDPQANATSGLGLEKIEGASAYRPLLGEGALLEKVQERKKRGQFGDRSRRNR